jgi:hypothetical protein
MKRNRYIFFVFILVNYLYSQTPGYMGKKTVAGYGIELSPVTYGANYYNKTVLGRHGNAEEIPLWLNSTHQLFYEHNFDKNLMFGCAVKYCRTGYDNQATVNNLSQKPQGAYKINAIQFQPYFKQYYRSYVAPWGRYIMFGPVASVIFTKHNLQMHIKNSVDQHDTLITDFGKNIQTHFSADFMLGFGRSRIINERTVIDFGFNFHLIALFTASETTDPDNVSSRNLSTYIAETAKARLRGVDRFNFFIKIGRLF